MTVVFRADANDDIGSGHVMRCMALAMRLQAEGVATCLLSIDLPGVLRNWMEERALPYFLLSGGDSWNPQFDAQQTLQACQSIGDASVMVVDQYALDAQWETTVRQAAEAIWVVDDLADRRHECDVLIDPGLHFSPTQRYAGLIPASAIQLLGPAYTFLRPEFDEVTSEQPRNGLVSRILVYLGSGHGVDHEILKILEALEDSLDHILVEVLLGALPESGSLKELILDRFSGVVAHEHVDSVAQLMRRADLSVGTCGLAAWERCAVGLPTLTILTADNQQDDAHFLNDLGAIRHLGRAESQSVEDWTSAFEWALQSPRKLLEMSRTGQELVPGWVGVRSTIMELVLAHE